MAKYLLTFGTDRIAGSRGGSTFQKAGTTYVIRKRNVPVQKKSPEQTAKQNAFASITQNWRELSPGEKATFSAEAINYPRTDSLGNVYYLNGQILQNSANLNLEENALPQITTMPAAAPIPNINHLNTDIDISVYVFSLSTNPFLVPANMLLQIFASAPKSGGRKKLTLADMKHIKSIPAGSPSANNFWNEYTAIYGNVLTKPGQKVSVIVRYLQTFSGIYGPQKQDTATVKA